MLLLKEALWEKVCENRSVVVCRSAGDNWTLNKLPDVHEDAFFAGRISLGDARRVHASVAFRIAACSMGCTLGRWVMTMECGTSTSAPTKMGGKCVVLCC